MVPMSKKQRIQFNIRMGEALYAKLEDAAKKSGVTLTAEAINRLEASFGNDPNAALIKKTARAIAVAIADEINRRDQGNGQ